MAIHWTNPLPVGQDVLHNNRHEHQQPPVQTPATRVKLATYNIQDGRNSRLAFAIRSLQTSHIDFAVITETRFPNDIYPRSFLGYTVTATQTTVANQGGIAFVYKDNEPNSGWSLESIQKHGPNVMSGIIVIGDCRTPVIGAYIPPSDLSSVPYITTALERFPNQTPLLLGDLNADIHNNTRPRDATISDLLAHHGLEDMLPHFRQRLGFRHQTTWSQRRNDTTYRSRCDYICGSDRRLFQTVSIRDPRHFTSDHLMLQATLLQRPTISHKKYLHGRKRFPLSLPKYGPRRQVDALFQEIKSLVTTEPPVPPAHRQWISEASLKLMDSRASLRRDPQHSRAEARRLTRQLNQSLKTDRNHRTEEAAEEIYARLEDNDLKGSYAVLKRWYRHASERPPKPSRQDLQKVSTEWETLYRKEDPTPPGDPIPIHVTPFQIRDDIPDADEIGRAVGRLKRGKAPGPTGIQADSYKDWYDLAHPEDDNIAPDAHRWELLVQLVQHCWQHGTIPEEATWNLLALLPKGNGDFRGIGLLETFWKIIEAVIDSRVGQSVQFHDILHGFLPRRGTGTAILEAKLQVELADIHQVPLFSIFLDLKKAYDTVDRDRLAALLTAYGVGPNSLRLLQTFWDEQKVVARQSGYHGPAFKAGRGLTQGGIVSPRFFNILLDAVIRHWLSLVLDNNGDLVHDGMGDNVAERLALFYADDGYISAVDQAWLQQATDILVGLFRRAGLQANASKTKAMTTFPSRVRIGLSNRAYERRTTGQGDTFRAHQRRRVTCPDCLQDLSAASLTNHMRRAHGREPPPDFSQLTDEQLGQQLPQTYQVSFPRILTECLCPHPNCLGRSRTWKAMREHFKARHPGHIVHIVEESPAPFPKCYRCDLQSPPTNLNERHYRSAACQLGRQRKQQRAAMVSAKRAAAVSFTVGQQDLDQADDFCYLGRILLSNNSDWATLYKNIKKARQQWGKLVRVLKQDGASPRAFGMFYKAVVQSVLLYGVETWTITDPMLKALQGFHNRAARRIGNKMARLVNGEWFYPPLEEAFQEAGLFSIEMYIYRRQQSIAQHIATRPIYAACRAARRRTGSPTRQARWWTSQFSAERVDAAEALIGNYDGVAGVNGDDPMDLE